MVNISRVDLNLFVVFDAIYSEGGITRAGERLSLTQPAISHSLARLRETLGDPLFVREGNSMVPTPVARALIKPVRQAIREIESSLNGLNRFDPATSFKEFRIGALHIVESAMLPALAALLRQQAPNVTLSCVQHDRDTLHTSLACGELDAAIDVLLPRAANVSFERLGSGRLVVAARAGHPRVKGALDLETYLSLDHVLATSRRSGLGAEDLALQRLGLRRRVVVRCQHYWTACQVAAATDLVLTMPEPFAAAANAAMDNRLLPFPVEVSQQDVYLYWHSSADEDPANRWLREQIRKCLPSSVSGSVSP